MSQLHPLIVSPLEESLRDGNHLATRSPADTSAIVRFRCGKFQRLRYEEISAQPQRNSGAISSENLMRAVLRPLTPPLFNNPVIFIASAPARLDNRLPVFLADPTHEALHGFAVLLVRAEPGDGHLQFRRRPPRTSSAASSCGQQYPSVHFAIPAPPERS